MSRLVECFESESAQVDVTQARNA